MHLMERVARHLASTFSSLGFGSQAAGWLLVFRPRYVRPDLVQATRNHKEQGTRLPPKKDTSTHPRRNVVRGQA